MDLENQSKKLYSRPLDQTFGGIVKYIYCARVEKLPLIILSVKTELAGDIQTVLEYGFDKYKDLLFGLVLGMFLAWVYHFFIGYRSLKKSYELLIKAKDETIDAYKALISERLEKINVEEKDQSYFKKVKKFFKSKNI